MPIPFAEYFPDQADNKSIAIEVENEFGLPPGTYVFQEEYCSTVGCDCRQAHFRVKADWTPKTLAYIDFGWEPAEYYREWLEHRDWDFEDPEEIERFENEVADMAGVSCDYFYCDKNRYTEALVRLFEKRLLAEDGFTDRVRGALPSRPGLRRCR